MTPLRNIVKRYWDTLGYPFSHTTIKSRYKHATAVSGAAKVARLGTFVSELMQVDLLTYTPTHLHTYSPTHLHTYSLTHLLTYSLTHLLTYSLT